MAKLKVLLQNRRWKELGLFLKTIPEARKPAYIQYALVKYAERHGRRKYLPVLRAIDGMLTRLERDRSE